MPGLELMAVSEAAGVFAVKDTLAKEYFRDVEAGKEIHVPEHHFPHDDPRQSPVVRWRSAAQLLYTNWLNYYVYQTTPYNLVTGN